MGRHLIITPIKINNKIIMAQDMIGFLGYIEPLEKTQKLKRKQFSWVGVTSCSRFAHKFR